jgi:UDP-glucose 4-epimerase
VVVVDPNRPADRRAEWIKADGRDPELILRVLDPGDTLIHLFHTTIPSDLSDNQAREDNENSRPLFKLLDALGPRKPGLFVYFSTGGQIYGPARRLPLKESSPLTPITAYGGSKMKMEAWTRKISQVIRMPYLILRPSNPYGPYQELSNRHGAVPHLLRSAIRATPFTAYGPDETVRDYIYIEDLAEAVIRLIEGGRYNKIVNIGSGTGTSLTELIALAEKVSGARINLVSAPIRPFDVPKNILDIGRLERLTGFRPAVTLEDGLRRTWEYLKEHEKT